MNKQVIYYETFTSAFDLFLIYKTEFLTSRYDSKHLDIFYEILKSNLICCLFY